MLGDGGKRHLVGRGQRTDRLLSAAQATQDVASRGVCEGVKDEIERRDTFNHVV